MVVSDFAVTSLREQIFNLGLPFEPVGVALFHILITGMFAKTPLALEYWQNPRQFRIWAGNRSHVPVGVVFMLLLGESNKQLTYWVGLWMIG